MTIFEEGVKAKKEGKSYNDNPYISGKTKLGNIILNETGGVWLSGFNSIARLATKKEIMEAANLDVSRFRKKRNSYYY